MVRSLTRKTIALREALMLAFISGVIVGLLLAFLVFAWSFRHDPAELPKMRI